MAHQQSAPLPPYNYMPETRLTIDHAVMVYGHLFPEVSEEEIASLKLVGERWKKYVADGVFIYEQHPFWITCVVFSFFLWAQ